ncbi:hypothetical protein WJT74_07865 [Sphingomicrobium sp. XHP0239]|uniref:hypothetical protein n=1 Tax=Sphingomicrobium maritimum TaxID=3133972 RepID=UPI0031CCC3C7
MQLESQSLKSRNAALADALQAVRSARYRDTMASRAAARDDATRDRLHRRRIRQDERELQRLRRHGIRIRVPENHRPRLGRQTAKKLYHRIKGILEGSVGTSVARGPDGKFSLHFSFVARGLGARGKRIWRSGEAVRAARYITREDALEEEERGWWSNIADDRSELVAFFRLLEDVERHDRKNANVYCTEIISLPYEMTAQQRRETVDAICGFFRERGLPLVAALHTPDRGGDQRNYHCHLIYSLRPAKRLEPFEWSFGLAKEADINCPDGIRSRRGAVVATINEHLRRARIAKTYTPLSNRARGMPSPPPKNGQIKTWAMRRLKANETRLALLNRFRSLVADMRDSLQRLHPRIEAISRTLHDRLTLVATTEDRATSASHARLNSCQEHLSNKLAGMERSIRSSELRRRLSVASARTLSSLLKMKDEVRSENARPFGPEGRLTTRRVRVEALLQHLSARLTSFEDRMRAGASATSPRSGDQGNPVDTANSMLKVRLNAIKERVRSSIAEALGRLEVAQSRSREVLDLYSSSVAASRRRPVRSTVTAKMLDEVQNPPSALSENFASPRPAPTIEPVGAAQPVDLDMRDRQQRLRAHLRVRSAGSSDPDATTSTAPGKTQMMRARPRPMGSVDVRSNPMGENDRPASATKQVESSAPQSEEQPKESLSTPRRADAELKNAGPANSEADAGQEFAREPERRQTEVSKETKGTPPIPPSSEPSSSADEDFERLRRLQEMMNQQRGR